MLLLLVVVVVVFRFRKCVKKITQKIKTVCAFDIQKMNQFCLHVYVLCMLAGANIYNRLMFRVFVCFFTFVCILM